MLTPKGRLAAYVIHTGPDLGAAEAARAAELGPSMVRSTAPIEELMASAGFDDIQAYDVTDVLARTCKTLLETRARLEAELRSEEGDPAFDEEIAKKEGMLEAIRLGLLRRSLFVGQRPGMP